MTVFNIKSKAIDFLPYFYRFQIFFLHKNRVSIYIALSTMKSINKSKFVNVFGLIVLSFLCMSVTSCSGGSSSNSGNGDGDNSGDCTTDQARCQSRQNNNIGR